VVRELPVLLGIEHLQEGCRRIASEVQADLVDLVQHHHGILGATLLHGLNHSAREGPDVGPAVAADLGLVPDPTE
jgi:hypothetical protein